MTDPYAAAAPQSTGGAFASWGARFAALLIDAIPTIVVFFLAATLFGTSETSDGGASFQLQGGGALLYFAFLIGWFVFNVLYLQGTKGQTIGKKVLGIGIYRVGTSEPLGMGMTFVRQLAHILDALPCYLGFLWPLWDKENRTFADMLLSSRSYKV
ncbi:RDD family protein [Aeromicrobium sp.]|uniref:RDD family protein n=1 Tax=Aeromicrobium sp. TaxID=1871063 RepID=UPI0030BC9680